MKYSIVAEAMVAMLEGLRLVAYQDEHGVWTIGYGTTRINGRPVTPGMTCTKAQAVEWLRAHLAEISAQISGALKVLVVQRQFDALVVLTYNVGIGAFLHSHLLAKINAQDPAAAEEFLDWCYITLPDGTRKKSNGLENRRRQEYALFTGDPVKRSLVLA